MSFLSTLDEIPSDQLVKELSRRAHLRTSEKCPYCEKPLVAPGGGKLKNWWDKPQNCACRFADVDAYHSPHVTKPLQYGD